MPTHTATYLYEPDSFIPLAQLTAGFDHTALAATGTDRQPLRCYQTQTAQLYYFQTDHLGTPQDITDTQGHIVWSGQYRAWGQLAQAHNGQDDKTHIQNPFRFQGQYHDRETGLHYNRFRYYDPRIGRFTTQDPIGLMGGDNLYQYAPNPTGWIDPLGLSPFTTDGLGREVEVSNLGVPDKSFEPKPGVSPYSRNKAAGLTAEQRRSVQGKACVVCGSTQDPMVADHKDALVVEHYRTGANDISSQTSLDAVQPHCRKCSNSQGGKASTFSRTMRGKL